MAMSTLSPMRFKTFIWPHNPRTYTIGYERRMAVHPIPGGSCELEAMGQSYRVMQGEGEFIGPGAYDQFKALASLFYENTPGLLVHPVWQAANAYFVDLSLAQEPRSNYVRYRFSFWECPPIRDEGLREVTTGTGTSGQSGGSGQAAGGTAGTLFHTVAKGETLWAIANRYGIPLARLIAQNPQIKNPNLITVGQKVVVGP